MRFEREVADGAAGAGGMAQRDSPSPEPGDVVGTTLQLRFGGLQAACALRMGLWDTGGCRGAVGDCPCSPVGDCPCSPGFSAGVTGGCSPGTRVCRRIPTSSMSHLSPVLHLGPYLALYSPPLPPLSSPPSCLSPSSSSSPPLPPPALGADAEHPPSTELSVGFLSPWWLSWPQSSMSAWVLGGCGQGTLPRAVRELGKQFGAHGAEYSAGSLLAPVPPPGASGFLPPSLPLSPEVAGNDGGPWGERLSGGGGARAGNAARRESPASSCRCHRERLLRRVTWGWGCHRRGGRYPGAWGGQA